MARASSRSPHPQRSAPRLNRQQRVSWLRLIRSENVGPATFRALVNEFGGAEAAIDALPVLSRRGGRAQDVRLCAEAEAEAELEAAESLGAHLVAIGEPGYPPALAQVDAPPPLIYVKGRLDLADIPIVAVVRRAQRLRRRTEIHPPNRHRSCARRLRDRLRPRARHRYRGPSRRARTWHHRRARGRPSTSSTRPRTKTCSAPSANRVSSLASALRASRRAARIFPGATG